ncbi:MAG: hypothetical protein HOC74_22810 [Gemmatimonadetes bacterium]|jgi:phytanoyl-CoA hydroxylase|nr:hypothetical protein [Gemmatimonadota bacterium]
MADFLSDEQWRQYEEEGYVKLGKVLSDEDLGALQERIDAIMMGEAKLDYDLLMMQLDSDSGRYGDTGPQTKGHKGGTLNYRKIEGLEFDRLFLEYMQRPLFRDICGRVYGAETLKRESGEVASSLVLFGEGALTTEGVTALHV